MRRALQIISLILSLASLTGWIMLGANRGWTKTSVEKRILDDVTGQEEIRYEKAFLPGIDLLAPALIISASLAGFSLLFQNRKPIHSTQSTSNPK